MRWLMAILVALVVLLQYRLWLAEGGIAEMVTLQARVERERAVNAELQARNAALEQQVLDLQTGNSVLEARAREDLGLIRKGEVFYRFENETAEAPR